MTTKEAISRAKFLVRAQIHGDVFAVLKFIAGFDLFKGQGVIHGKGTAKAVKTGAHICRGSRYFYNNLFQLNHLFSSAHS